MKVGLYLGDVICGAMQLLIRGFEKSGRKNIHTHLEFQWWREKERRAEGIRRAAFLSFAALLHHLSMLPATTFCRSRGEDIFLQAMLSNTFLFASIAWRGIYPLTSTRCEASQWEWRPDMFGFTPGSSPYTYSTYVHMHSWRLLSTAYGWNMSALAAGNTHTYRLYSPLHNLNFV